MTEPKDTFEEVIMCVDWTRKKGVRGIRIDLLCVEHGCFGTIREDFNRGLLMLQEIEEKSNDHLQKFHT